MNEKEKEGEEQYGARSVQYITFREKKVTFGHFITLKSKMTAKCIKIA